MIAKESIQQIEPLLKTRAFLYDFLRRTFLQEPTLEFLASIKDSRLFENFPFEEDQEEIASGVKQILAFTKEKDVTSPEVFNSLHWDYTRMFIGPDRLPAPLWESAYMNDDRLVFQEQTLVVRRVYLKYQFLPERFKQEPDDHLGLELDFMYRLCELTLESLQQEDYTKLKEVLVDQKAFLQDHLLKWVPELAKNIIKSTNLAFYEGIAKVLNGYLALDLEALEELLDINYEVS
ncbi:MAG: TorD/DmsD family molecular chaperone [Desulfitobacterium sp.]